MTASDLREPLPLGVAQARAISQHGAVMAWRRSAAYQVRALALLDAAITEALAAAAPAEEDGGG